MGKHWPQMLTTLMLGVTSSSSSSWPESFTFLSTCNNATFSAFVVPLALQVKLSYTATHGAYYNSSDAANGTVDGWSRVHDLDANPVAGGMHAIVFVEAPSPASAATSSPPVAIPRVVLSTPKVVAFFFFFFSPRTAGVPRLPQWGLRQSRQRRLNVVSKACCLCYVLKCSIPLRCIRILQGCRCV